MAMCITGTSNKDSLVCWIKLLQVRLQYPRHEKVFVSTNLCHFRYLRQLILNVANFTLLFIHVIKASSEISTDMDNLYMV